MQPYPYTTVHYTTPHYTTDVDGPADGKRWLPMQDMDRSCSTISLSFLVQPFKGGTWGKGRDPEEAGGTDRSFWPQLVRLLPTG